VIVALGGILAGVTETVPADAVDVVAVALGEPDRPAVVLAPAVPEAKTDVVFVASDPHPATAIATASTAATTHLLRIARA
jgi:hypothetical protein